MSQDAAREERRDEAAAVEDPEAPKFEPALYVAVSPSSAVPRMSTMAQAADEAEVPPCPMPVCVTALA